MESLEDRSPEGQGNDGARCTKGNITPQADPVPEDLPELKAGCRRNSAVLGGHQGGKVYQWLVTGIDSGARKSATTLSDPLTWRILLENLAMYDRWRVCRGDQSVELPKAKVRGLWSVKIIKDLPSKK